jgi:hypothetical protein
MSSFLDIAYGSVNYNNDDESKTRYMRKKLHPLSNLPFDVPRNLLVEKYCKLLEMVNDLNNRLMNNDKEREIQRLTKLVENLRGESIKNNELINQLRQNQFNSSAPSRVVVSRVPAPASTVPFHIIQECETLRERCNFLEKNNQILTNEINVTKKEALQEIVALKKQKACDNEFIKKNREKRKRQKLEEDAFSLQQLSFNKFNINNTTKLMLTPIPRIAYKLKTRLIAYISKNRIDYIDQLSAIQGFGKKRLKILKAISFGNIEAINLDIKQPFDEEFPPHEELPPDENLPPSRSKLNEIVDEILSPNLSTLDEEPNNSILSSLIKVIGSFFKDK